MGNLQKIKSFKRELPDWVQFAGGLLFILLFAVATAVFAVNAIKAHEFFPSHSTVPAEPAIYPQYTFAPSAPLIQHISDTTAGKAAARWFRGIASWYGPAFDGRITASGQVFNMYAMTAATTESHPELPLGTKVRVFDGHSGRSVVVRITDRGPLPKGRILDLSYGAARKLKMVKPGLAHVRLHVLRWGKDQYHRNHNS